MKLPTFLLRGKNKYYSIATIILIIIILAFTFGGGTNTSYPLTIEQKNFTNTVKITGKAVFDDRADLGFDKNGRISAIYKKVGDKVNKGDIIASIDNGDINAELAQKQAAVDRERAKLDSTLQGTRPEQLQIYKQAYIDATDALIISIRSSYLESESALISKVDTVFTNGSSVNPEINIINVGDSEKKLVEKDRQLVNEAMNEWKSVIAVLNSDKSESNIANSKNITSNTITKLKSFMDTLGKVASDLNENNSGYSSTQIDTIRDDINSASQAISTASNAFVTSLTAYNNAKDTYLLAESGSTSFDKDAQMASLRSAEADLANVRARISSTIISAPFSGIVTRMDAKLGEVVSPSDSPVTVMNLDSLLIEAYVPEININQVKIGDKTSVTFDAFGDEQIFDGVVSSIDLAETMRDGVATYKIQVKLSTPTQFIRSGMTSDVEIITNEESDIIVIPKGYTFKKEGAYYVMKGTTTDSAKESPIEVSEIGSLGYIKVVSGLEDGDMIVAPENTTK